MCYQLQNLIGLKNLCEEYDNSKFPAGTRGFSVGWRIRKKLCKLFKGRSEYIVGMVSRALRFKRNSPLAKEIRQLAIKLFKEEIKRFKRVIKNPYTIIEEEFDFEEKKKIQPFDVSADFRKELCNKYGYKRGNVNAALSFTTNSPLEKGIRKITCELSDKYLNRLKDFYNGTENKICKIESFDVGSSFYKELIKKYGEDNVYAALSFRLNSPLGKEIRAKAIELAVKELNRVIKLCKDDDNVPAGTRRFSVGRVWIRKKIGKDLDCNIGMVSSSLRFEYKSKLQKEIRQAAIKLFKEEIERFKEVCDMIDESGKEKYVYIISHPKYPGVFKVGIAKDLKKRMSSYQTSDPDRLYKLVYSYLTEKYKDIEHHIHTKFDRKIIKEGNKKDEWVKGNLQDIIDEIENYKHN